MPTTNLNNILSQNTFLTKCLNNKYVHKSTLLKYQEINTSLDF